MPQGYYDEYGNYIEGPDPRPDTDVNPSGGGTGVFTGGYPGLDDEPTPAPPGDNTNGSGGGPPPNPRPTTRFPTGSRPPAPTGQSGRVVWNDDYWDGRSAFLGGWLIEGENPGPTPGPTPGPNKGGPQGMSGGEYGNANTFAFPQFNAPMYTPGPAFQAPAPFAYDAFQDEPAFSYESFKVPTADSIYADPSYAMRRDEGLRSIERSAAAKGLTRLPETMKALSGWNQDFASREYGNIFDRAGQTYNTNRGNALENYTTNRNNKFQTYSTNRNNAADAYALNYGVSRDVFDRGEQQKLSAFDRNYKSAFDAFDYNRFRPAQMTFDDMYRRYKAELDATTTLASGGND